MFIAFLLKPGFNLNPISFANFSTVFCELKFLLIISIISLSTDVCFLCEFILKKSEFIVKSCFRSFISGK